MALSPYFYEYPPKNDFLTKETKYINKLKGTFMHFFFTMCWVGGLNVPFACIFCLFYGGFIRNCFAALLIFLSFFPLIIKPGKWAAFKHSIPGWGECYHKECKIILTDEKAFSELHSLKRHAFCYHPHGILSWGFVLNAGFRDFFEPLYGLVADALCYAPLWYWFITCWTDATRPASKKYILKYMEDGDSFGIIPGGFEEATIHKYGSHRVYLKKRKGFVKYALQFGYALVPVYTFGETDTYSNMQGMFELRLFLNRLGLPAVLPFGVWWFPLLPKPVCLVTVVGKPLQLPKIVSPSDEDINKYHQLYIAALLEVFENNKELAGYPTAELELW